jgi:hypothetical protein
MRENSLVALVTASVLFLGGCSPVLQPAETLVGGAQLDPKLSQSTWIEEGSLVSLIVSTRVTRFRLTQDYIPIEIVIVNRGLEGITLTRESFTLVDASGNRYPVVGREELSKGYRGSTDVDRRNFAEAAPVALGKYQSFTLVPSNFSPGFDNPIALDRVSLPRFSYILDFLYFPKPPGLEPGQPMELLVAAPELEEAVFVRFSILGD